jgi:hypothetical protein
VFALQRFLWRVPTGNICIGGRAETAAAAVCGSRPRAGLRSTNAVDKVELLPMWAFATRPARLADVAKTMQTQRAAGLRDAQFLGH